jgi:hypothetical protein
MLRHRSRNAVRLDSTATAPRTAVGATWPFIPIGYGDIKAASLKHFTATQRKRKICTPSKKLGEHDIREI